MVTKRVIIVGGGAAGYFAAVNAASMNPELEFLILEQSPKVLGKVKISGGGRCNVTHACFEPRELCKFYPRGNKALMGPFTRFMTGDTMEWFESRGVELKIEDDGRVFPVSDQSQSIIDCLSVEAHQKGVVIKCREQVVDIQPHEGQWEVITKSGSYLCDYLIVASGSSKLIWSILDRLGHEIVEPVPSLFTFNINDPRIKDLPGLSVEKAVVSVTGSKLKATGPLLITHWGLSGPAVLKLSAWGARELNQRNYDFSILVDWMADWKGEPMEEHIAGLRIREAKKLIQGTNQFKLPSRLWKSLVKEAGIRPEQRWADLSKSQAQKLHHELRMGKFEVKGKSTFKDEFVTAGGVKLKEVNFKTMESKIHPKLFFAGEVLDIDAVTGGFNFQAAWTTGWIAAQSLSQVN
ncbi:MAG: NAD(P)/FAD-dependent oxidoreductase [Bacteroidia bacterium]|nr:NAD(P)/FAD-dependent oxidoreductase [Bacteroidia bacterium]